MQSKHSRLSWSDRFALIDHYQPDDQAICQTFSISADELSTARNMRDQGTFGVSSKFDSAQYGNPFAGDTESTISVDVPVTKVATATVHAKPETATKRVKEPKKRGRTGNKIETALRAITNQPVPIDQFCQQHNVSQHVMKQANTRFVKNLPPEVAQQIGTVYVRKDKNTKVTMIWREDTVVAQNDE